MKPAASARVLDGQDVRHASLVFVPAGAGSRRTLLDQLTRAGLPCAAAADTNHGLRLLSSQPDAVAVIDLAGSRAALAGIRAIRGRCPTVPIVAVADPDDALISGEALQAGAFDLLPWPFESGELLTVVANAREQARQALPPAPADGDHGPLIAQSQAMRALADRVASSARLRGVLLVGEEGSGRTRVARALHAARGADSAFVVEDCAEEAPDDLEQRLFGVATAGTPRSESRNGKTPGFERVSRASAIHGSSGGTLCLRNPHEAPGRVQVRLARLLRDREAELDGHPGVLLDLDLHIVACAGPELDDAVADGRMRADLYDRLAQARIDVPPLRHRREDVPGLVALLLRRACDELGVQRKGISRSAVQVLSALPWRGNVAELRALLEAVVRSSDRPVVQLDDVLGAASFDGAVVRVEAGVTLRDAKARFERECITAVLARHHGRVGDAARALGIQRTNLYRKVRELRVDRPRPGRRGNP